MKLILTAAVDNLGEAGEIVEVKGGYGRNFLLPRGLAIPATRGAEKQIRDIQRVQKEREVRDLDHAKELRDQLDQLTGVKVPVRTSEKGKLFGSVKPGDIAAAVKAAGGPSLDKRRINVPKGLVTKTGGYQVKVNLHDSVEGKVNFEVVSK
ncbi:50S ribosomal protein L9 [Corynebacterium sp. NML98-0116]|uniref:Large ribosomal subunit protein bL9 n=2 Tax=Corynebacterium TaxID=1716 RepID=A0ABD4TU39_9CORY|nr:MULTISPECIES: 50S ribosomal protein L9 [Corynebacterium]AOX04857.1 50S ribosomal protein L9 [Corynebacterium sp. NML98-0116]MCO6394573.1 50S ribosomal protein L9 [Corynebacterium lipophilum]MCQ4608747.1 50S ribosomal protein L9 [Corynebacterium pseudogenitalium]MCQ4609887.1 50S ribosomal protein L9 [Corynebacterium sp. CCUG 61414]MCQ4613043.1 50S ribosomal protein L9 [Corynebacterium sp. CCUG 51687]